MKPFVEAIVVPGEREAPCRVDRQPGANIVSAGLCPSGEFLFRPEELDGASGVPDVLIPIAKRYEEMDDSYPVLHPAIRDP